MGDREEGEAASFVPATGFPLPPVDVGRTVFRQFPSGLTSRTIFSPYPLFYFPPPQRLQKNPDSFIVGGKEVPRNEL